MIMEKLNEAAEFFDKLSESDFDFSFLRRKDHSEEEVRQMEATTKACQVFNAIRDLKFLVQASEIKDIVYSEDKPFKAGKALFSNTTTGDFVAVRPCDEKYEKKTFLGVYLGEAALSQGIEIKDNVIRTKLGFYNPAIFVPELNEIIYGCGSWWGRINSEEDLKQLTDADIENVWYVKALNAITKQGKESSDGSGKEA